MSFLNHANYILDELPFNICYIIYFYLHNLNILMILMSDWKHLHRSITIHTEVHVWGFNPNSCQPLINN